MQEENWFVIVCVSVCVGVSLCMCVCACSSSMRAVETACDGNSMHGNSMHGNKAWMETACMETACVRWKAVYSTPFKMAVLQKHCARRTSWIKAVWQGVSHNKGAVAIPE